MITGISLSVSGLFAQDSSQRGRFDVNFSKGCSPLKVIINETDTFPDDVVIQYDFDGDSILLDSNLAKRSHIHMILPKFIQ